TGVRLITHHGEHAYRRAHPSQGREKIYVAKVRGKVAKSLCTTPRARIELDDGPVRATDCQILDSNERHSLVQVELHEGRNRIVRRMFDAVGHPVEELVRTQFGPVRLGTLPPGEVRELGKADVGALMAAAGL